MAHLKGRTVAGLAPAMHPGPPAWMHYVNVLDADAVAAKVSAAGGQVIVAPMDVLTFGRMSVFADPAGAVFGTWQPGEHPGAGLVNEAGTFCWSELLTTDVARAIDFYRSVFGWTAQGTAADPYVEFQLAGRSIAGLMAKPAEMPAEAPPFWGSISPWTTPTPRRLEPSGSVARWSWRRWTSSRADSPCWPIRPAPSST